MAKSLKQGFTLIELMIVVAIIGLLAALAIPNFIKFQARSRQAEARSNLKAGYTSEKSYYGDKQTYYDIFSVMGFEPEMNNRYAYFAQNLADDVGEKRSANTTAFAPNPSQINPLGPGGTGVISCDQTKWTNSADPGYIAPLGIGLAQNPGSPVGPLVGDVGAYPLGTACPQGQCEFVLSAAGNIDNDTTVDEWFISSQSSAAGGGGNACVNPPAQAPNGNTGNFAEGEPVNPCNDVNI